MIDINTLTLHTYFYHDDGETILSIAYKDSQNRLIIIDKPEICFTTFTYKRYCQKQNEWMTEFNEVYRFYEGDNEAFDQVFADVDLWQSSKTFNRQETLLDPTPLEYYFENRFQEVYGAEAFKYLTREYPIPLLDGRTGYVDFVLINFKGKITAIEENGISYHHPQLIGKDRYRNVLLKQNSIVKAGGRMFRWDTESINNKEKIDTEILSFIGDITNYVIQTGLSVGRKFFLYEHQEKSIENLSKVREAGNTTSLVVFPTGTGKSALAIEDLNNFSANKESLKVLTLVPSTALKNQWTQLFEEHLPTFKDVTIATYSGIYNRYKIDSPNTFDYILIDEAHHAVAPVLKKVINHYTPEFLLGLTATDERLDTKKLETIFGEYEVQLDLKTAIEKGILCQIRAYRLETNVDLTKVRFNGKEYYNSDLERAIIVPSRNELIADIVLKYFYPSENISFMSGIIFCVSVEHAKKMASLLKSRGFNAEAIDGKDPKKEAKIQGYMNRTIQIICTCNLLNEGWDAPHTGFIVMARPTLSKVLYLQQLGRGTRRNKGKEALYVIDVVDNYGAFGSVSNCPWSLHALFEFNTYKAFGDMIPRIGDTYTDIQYLDTIHEIEMKLDPIEIFTMEKLYGDYLSVEQLARELFVSTGTVNSWIQKGEIQPGLTIPMGRSNIHLFIKDSVHEIQMAKGLKEHTEDTIVQDFWEFIEEGTYTFSYKIYFILSLLDAVDSSGDAPINEVLKRYQQAYLGRIESGQIVDRINCPYLDKAYVTDDKVMKASMLTNPFEKFERKRFISYSSDVAILSFHNRIWEELISNHGKERLKKKMEDDLQVYYNSLDNKA